MESTDKIESLATQIRQLSDDEKRKLLQLAPDLANFINDEIADPETLKKAYESEMARVRKERSKTGGALFAKPTYTFEKLKEMNCPIKYIEDKEGRKIATFIDERLYHAPERFGEYVCSYLSDNEEVRVDFFKKPVGVNPVMVVEVYIRIQKGLRYWEVVDLWPYDIQVIARTHGFKGINFFHFAEPYDV